MIIQEATTGHRKPITDLLEANQLPSAGLAATPGQFWVALDSNRVVGAIGLEIYEQYGLLRSMVVDKDLRGNGIAAMLVGTLENQASGQGVSEIFLLTETAPDYFLRKGYREIKREEVPQALHSSTEFSYLCPVSARVFQKSIHHV